MSDDNKLKDPFKDVDIEKLKEALQDPKVQQSIREFVEKMEAPLHGLKFKSQPICSCNCCQKY